MSDRIEIPVYMLETDHGDGHYVRHLRLAPTTSRNVTDDITGLVRYQEVGNPEPYGYITAPLGTTTGEDASGQPCVVIPADTQGSFAKDVTLSLSEAIKAHGECGVGFRKADTTE